MSSLALALLFCLICSSLPFAHQGQQVSGGFVSVKEAGAKGDGITDDTTAIQSVLDRFSQHMPSAQARGATIYFPLGVYLISSPLFYYGSPGTGIKLQGALGRTRGTGYGSTIRWKGSPGGTMFIGIGMNNSQLDSIEFDVNGSARVGIHLAATNPINTALGTAVPPGTATVAPRSMTNITSGTVLNVGRGTNMEPVYVTASTGSTFTATFAKSHSANDPVGGSAGSSGVELRDVSVLNVPSARTTFDQSALKSSAAILIGNQTSGGTPQVSEVSFSRLDLAGNNGSAGIAFITGGNIKNFLLSDVVMGGFHYGIDIVTGGSGTYSIFRPVFANTTVADVRANGATVFISGAEAEGTTGHRFLVGSIGDNPYATTIIGSSWESSAPSDDYVVAYSGSLTLIGNKFFNLRTSSSLPKLQIGDPLFTAHAPSILFSVGNYYMNAPSGYAPIYDGSNNQALPTYYSSQPVNVTSLGDYGGTGGALVHLYNYLSTSALTSQSASAVARSGLVRAGDTDTAVAFRDHRNHADVQGLAKDTSDVVFVGGTAGIGLNSPVQIGNAPNENIKAPAKGTGMGPKTPGTVVGWVPVKVGDSTYFMPLMK